MIPLVSLVIRFETSRYIVNITNKKLRNIAIHPRITKVFITKGSFIIASVSPVSFLPNSKYRMITMMMKHTLQRNTIFEKKRI